MPELPEVETVARSLRSGGMTGEPVINRQISAVDLLNRNTLIFDGTPEECSAALKGHVIRSVSRRAKYLVIATDDPFILIHLRMSGDLRLETEADHALLPHDRLIFRFTDGTRLVFNDVRKFGRVWVTHDPAAVLGDLGVEPLSGDFTEAYLREKPGKKRGAIKTVLLDQHLIAGIGNIYADESLFAAGIRPDRPANSLTDEEWARLHRCIRETLSAAIARNGSSFDWAYKGGHFQNEFKVYQKEGTPCPNCGTLIERIVLGQRGTHFCPKCQH